VQAEKSAEGGTNCLAGVALLDIEGNNFIGFFAMARCLLIDVRARPNCARRSSAMLPAIGAASIALDAIQSLTSPPPSSSKPVGFGSVLPDASDSSAASPAESPTISGFSGAQISSGNISALLEAQDMASANFAQAIDPNSTSDHSNSTSDASATEPNSASGTAASTYSAIDQLVQSTAIPLGFNPFSVSI
jgi:hypothetical protein